MLTEIRCEKFQEKVIRFHPGLNVVLGDEISTNSIGKSTLLMVIDFIYGGKSFLEHNEDVISALGHHEYIFTFKFGDQVFCLKRKTDSDKIYFCGTDYMEIGVMSLEEYQGFLKVHYSLEDLDLSFRAISSLFLRVWGKENLDVKHPLHIAKAQNQSACIDGIIKLFKKYDLIRFLSEDLKNKEEERSTISKAFNKGLIPKISKKVYEEKIKTIESIDLEIEEIRSELKKYAINISEIANRGIIDLKTEKDKLLSEKLVIDNRLLRIRNDLEQNKNIKSKRLSLLLKYFPEVDVEKIEEVEQFHNKMAKILRKELKDSEGELVKLAEEISKEISLIDKRISELISDIDNPNLIVDRIYDISQKYSAASREVAYFEKHEKIKLEVKEAKILLNSKKNEILNQIENAINSSIRINVSKIYGEERRSPVLHLKPRSYTFELPEDTGTGKAYSNLILLDLAFLENTVVPFLAHDSILFKNIQNHAVAKLIDLYEKVGKQVFISIDGIGKYGEVAEKKLRERRVIELSDKNLLYIKDWRK